MVSRPYASTRSLWEQVDTVIAHRFRKRPQNWQPEGNFSGFSSCRALRTDLRGGAEDYTSGGGRGRPARGGEDARGARERPRDRARGRPPLNWSRRGAGRAPGRSVLSSGTN